MAGETLSDEQLHALLHDAETRLKSIEQRQSGILVPQTSSFSHRSDQSLESILTPCVQITPHGPQVDPNCLIRPEERRTSNTIMVINDPIASSKKASKSQKPTAGAAWFNLPRTLLTPALKRDIQILRSRSVLDPHRHYKKDSSKAKIPEYSQMGTVIEGPTEYFSARLTNKQRKKTFLEDVLEGERQTGKFKRKYDDLMQKKRSGKKEHWKKTKAMRRKGGIGKG